MGQSPNASTKGIIIFAIGISISSPNAQLYPALENILQKINVFMATTINPKRLANTITNIKNKKTFALIIGNEDYSSFQMDLNTDMNVEFASTDAKTFKKYLTNTHKVEISKFSHNIRAFTLINIYIHWLYSQ